MKTVQPGDIANLFFVGRNYVKHIEELENEKPERPLIFSKPTSCLSIKSEIPYPSHSRSLHYEGEMVFFMTGFNGQSADSTGTVYAGCGIDFTARDIQKEIKSRGWPWFEAKCFRASAIISASFVPVSIVELTQLSVETYVNNELRQKGSYRETIFSFQDLLQHLSEFVELTDSDLLFTGTPAGVGPVVPGDRIVVNLKLRDSIITQAECEVIDGRN